MPDPTTDSIQARNDEIASLRSLSKELTEDRDRVRALLDIANRKLAERCGPDVLLGRIKVQDEIIAEAASALATMTILWLKRGELEARLTAAEADHADLKQRAEDLDRRALLGRIKVQDEIIAGHAEATKRLVEENTELRIAKITAEQKLRDLELKLGGAQQTASIATAAQLETGRQNALLYNIATAWALFYEQWKTWDLSKPGKVPINEANAVQAAWSAAEQDGIFKDPDDLPF